MSKLIVNYSTIAMTIFLTVYGQLVMKWRMSSVGPLPADSIAKAKTIFFLLFDPYIFSGYVAAFMASIAWIITLSKFPLSQAYPFMSLNFVIVLCLSGWILNEPVSTQKMFGVGLIVMGTIVASRG